MIWHNCLIGWIMVLAASGSVMGRAGSKSGMLSTHGNGSVLNIESPVKYLSFGS